MIHAEISKEKLQEGQKIIIVINLSGNLDELSTEDIAQEFYKIIENAEENTSFIINAEGLSFMNSRSIGYFIDFYKKIEKKGGKIVIANASDNILDIMDVVGLNNFYTNYPSLEAAKNALLQR